MSSALSHANPQKPRQRPSAIAVSCVPPTCLHHAAESPSHRRVARASTATERSPALLLGLWPLPWMPLISSKRRLRTALGSPASHEATTHWAPKCTASTTATTRCRRREPLATALRAPSATAARRPQGQLGPPALQALGEPLLWRWIWEVLAPLGDQHRHRWSTALRRPAPCESANRAWGSPPAFCRRSAQRSHQRARCPQHLSVEPPQPIRLHGLLAGNV